MPGIAGVILTIGMAVDANVIIFERIRENLALGKTVRSAVDSGFSRALVTILDANITTLITALVLYQFGTGPIKGFAVTLSIGIIGSMFASIVLVKAIFDGFITNVAREKLSI
jgi:preprotein translocase subunit SecD